MSDAKTPKMAAGDGYTRLTAAITLLGLGGFIAWAGFVPLQEGVAASGTVVVDSSRKQVQHFEGGIIEDIRVREGDRVEAGAVLVVLKGTASQASRDQVVQKVAALRAAQARLEAITSGAAAPDMAGLDGLTLPAAEQAEIEDREISLFRQQVGALNADLGVLSARRTAFIAEARQREGELTIARRTLETTREEYTLMQTMLDQQLVRRDQVTALERALTGTEGEIARLQGAREEALAQARDADAQAAQTRARFAQEVAAELREVNSERLAAEEALAAAQDVLDRSEVIAPVSGEVLNLGFTTQGGVVQPGETLMEIVPVLDAVTAAVRIRPSDRAAVFEGLGVRATASAYRSWTAPSLQGEIAGVSADLKTDPVTGDVYYEARVRITPESLAKAEDLAILPGMPMDVFIFSGRSRTTLDYLFEPIAASLFKGVRTQ